MAAVELPKFLLRSDQDDGNVGGLHWVSTRVGRITCLGDRSSTYPILNAAASSGCIYSEE